MGIGSYKGGVMPNLVFRQLSLLMLLLCLERIVVRAWSSKYSARTPTVDLSRHYFIHLGAHERA